MAMGDFVKTSCTPIPQTPPGAFGDRKDKYKLLESPRNDPLNNDTRQDSQGGEGRMGDAIS
jgi:hypothetical protein